ncbi:hypothetical protein ACSSS7_002129 [Eimeria intestinalis]
MGGFLSSCNNSSRPTLEGRAASTLPSNSVKTVILSNFSIECQLVNCTEAGGPLRDPPLEAPPQAEPRPSGPHPAKAAPPHDKEFIGGAPLWGPPRAQLPASHQAFPLCGLPTAQQTLQPATTSQDTPLHHFNCEGTLGGLVGAPWGPPPSTLFFHRHPQSAAPVGTPSKCSPLCMQNVAEPPLAGGKEAPLACVWGPLGALPSPIADVTKRIEDPPGATTTGPLLFRWRPRKSYKQRTMGLASTKSRRRWAARRR